MKKTLVFITVILLLFTGCAQENEEISAQPSSTPSIADESVIDNNNKDDNNKDDNYLDTYVETFPEYKFEGESEAMFGDRHFSSAVLPQNIPEELVANYYYYDIAGEFQKLSDICGENKSLKISATNMEKQFNEGVYIKEYIIKDISVVKKDEIGIGMPANFFFLEKDVASYKLAEFTMIRAEISMSHSEEALKWGPQLGDGDYTRSFLCGKSNNTDEWKIYGVYWE